MDPRYRPTTEEERKIFYCLEIPRIAGTYKGLVRIFGGGATMWKDFEESERLFPNTDKLCVNVAAMFVPHPVHHIFSWHYKQISYIKGWRQAEIPDDQSIVHSVHDFERIDWVWRFEGGTSASGLTAIDLAWLLGYRQIVLCGIPMDNVSYFYKPNVNIEMFDKYRHQEINKLFQRYGRAVRSFSGYTKDVFGHPTVPW